MAEEDVAAQAEEASEAHDEQAGQADATAGEGNQPEGTGYAAPDTGQGEAAESAIPEGLDELDPEKVQAAEAEGGGDDDGALDVSALVGGEGGDADAEADAGDADEEA